MFFFLITLKRISHQNCTYSTNFVFTVLIERWVIRHGSLIVFYFNYKIIELNVNTEIDEREQYSQNEFID